MAYRIKNFIQGNKNINVLEQLGAYTVFEHCYDHSVTPSTAQTKWFMSEMNCTPKQLLMDVRNGVKLQKGAMQMIFGDVECTTGIKGVGDLLTKSVKGKVTGEAGVKPEYRGHGQVLGEPTYKYLLLEDMSNWNGFMACDDGMFYACDMSVEPTAVMRSNISSAAAGGKGLFNLALKGTGIVCLESLYPREELYILEMQNDVVKVDGSNVICWSGGLQFTVERSSKTLLGSAVNGEGFVNVYRGTGKLLIAPRV